MKINDDSLRLETKSHHLLVVDDDRINRELLTHLFERDYEISTASGGKEALQMLKDKTDIDLVMLDIMMPNMSGIEVLTEIRETPETHDLPVILISAMANTRDVVNGLRLGANDYITKPVDVSVVVARVKTQLTVKRLLDERKETIVELEKAETLRAQLFRIASHDLKTPLNNISMAEHLLRKTITSTKDTDQMLDTIKLTIDSMSGIITNFLDMVELQAGHIDIKLKPIDLTDVVYNVLTQYEISASKKTIKLVMGEVKGWVTADAARLVQVVSNLVSNAIKYSPSDTKVDVYTKTKDGKGYLYIKDEGPGIPESERDQLFTEFGKLSTIPTAGESSTGLGLWIVKHLTSLQHGSVGVEFPETGGSIFWVALPECPAPSEENNFDGIDDKETPKPTPKDEDDTVSLRPKLPTQSEDKSSTP
jgi:two-component system, sensor histidine kinase and response regulator